MSSVRGTRRKLGRACRSLDSELAHFHFHPHVTKENYVGKLKERYRKTHSIHEGGNERGTQQGTEN
jgi:hypothetical protein